MHSFEIKRSRDPLVFDGMCMLGKDGQGYIPAINYRILALTGVSQVSMGVELVGRKVIPSSYCVCQIRALADRTGALMWGIS